MMARKFDFEEYDHCSFYCATSDETKNFIETLTKEANRVKSALYYHGYEIADYPAGYYYFYRIGNAYAELEIVKSTSIYKKFKALNWSDFMEKKIFTKADLKNGDVIKRRNGDVEIVCVETGTLIAKNGWDSLDNINSDLTYNHCSIRQFDIVKVRRPNRPNDCRFDAFDGGWGTLVYDRERDDPEVEEMTMEDVCKALGKRVKIVDGK